MHQIDFKKVWVSNFLSYGSNINEFLIEKGMTWIKGPNGAGKSALIEALNFILFGKAYRNIKVKDLKNTANKSKLVAEGEFDVTTSKGTDHYVVRREMNNSGGVKMVIFKNDDDGKANGITQKKLQEEVLGFNQNIFENVISLNTIQTTPIIDMEPKDKRKLVESILTLHLDKLKEKNKKALKEAQTSFVNAESDVEKYGRDVEDIKVILLKLKQEKEDDIKKYEDEIKEHEVKIVEFNKSKDVIATENSEIETKGKSLKAEFEKYADVDTKINNYKSAITNINSLAEWNKNIDVKKESLKTKEKEIDPFKKIIDDFKETEFDNTELDKLNKDNNDLTVEVFHLSTSMKGIEDHVKELKSGVPCITCSKLYTEQDIKTTKDGQRNIWKAHKKQFDEANVKKSELIKNIEKLTKEKERITEAFIKYNETKIKFDSLSESIDSIKTEIAQCNKTVDNIVYIIEGYDCKGLSIDDVNKKIEAMNDDQEKKNSLQKELDELRGNLITKKSEITSVNSDITTYETLITGIKTKIQEKKDKNVDDAYASTQKKLKNTEGDLERAKEKILKYSDKIEICKYIEKMYNDDGIKKLVLSIFMPNLNKTIAHNLNLFELPFMIEFDDAMEYTFTSKFGSAPTYNNLSQGQKRKLNFAISMAFRDFVSLIADFKINILFLDEVLDISTDFEALNHMLELVKTKCSDIGGIYLMTHRGEDFSDKFDNIMEIEHDGRYSEIVDKSNISR